MSKPHGNTGNRNAAKPVTRSDRIVIRVTSEEKKLAQSLAEASGQPLSDYARSKILP